MSFKGDNSVGIFNADGTVLESRGFISNGDGTVLESRGFAEAQSPLPLNLD